MFIIPDELLDTMSCDNCHKLLSVGPVKVYPNRRTKCGRCSEPDDGGVVSQFELFAEKGIFKCVNRFDGCEQLLSYTQVSDHEAICPCKKYVCPMCPEAADIPTYFLVKHFSEDHKSCFLTNPSFEFDATAPCTKINFYRLKDSLFFIECKISSALKLNTIFLGDEKKAEAMQQKFTVQFGGASIETGTKPCDSYDCETLEGFSLLLPTPSDLLITVNFKLSLPEYKDFIYISDCNFVDPHKISLERKISLSLKLRSTSDLSVLSGTSLLCVVKYLGKYEKRIIHPFCFICSFPIAVFEQYMRLGKNEYQPICAICKPLYGRKQLDHTLFSFSPENPITFSCIWSSWGCSETHFANEIFDHDVQCSYQPMQPCPVPSCSHHAKLIHLKEHFKKIHPTDIVSLVPKLDSSLGISSTKKRVYVWAHFQFILVELAFGSYSHCISGEVVSCYMPKMNNLIKGKPKLVMYRETVLCCFERNHFCVSKS